MSRYWQNVVWETKEGTWGIGFFKRIDVSGGEYDDYDSEWDDKFDESEFAFASTGHATQDSAMDSWPGANPGSYNVCHYTRSDAKYIADYEDMAKAYKSPAYAEERRKRIERAEKAAFRKVLRDKLRQNPPTTGRYTVGIGSPTFYSIHDELLKQEGDWLGFALSRQLKNGKTSKPVFQKVWNTKTQNIGPNVASVVKNSYPRW